MNSHDDGFHHKLTDAMGRSPEFIISQIYDLDNYVQCFVGPTEDCVDLSNRIIDKYFRECSGLSNAEQRRRARWLKTEMKRRILARSVPSNDPIGNA